MSVKYGVGSTMAWSGVDGGGDMHLSFGIAYCGLVRITDFLFLVSFSYNHILFVKVRM
jgi:hypothetical protein